MTTYSYKISFSHWELRALESAFKHYMEHIDETLASGANPANAPHMKFEKQQLLAILDRRRGEATMTSTNNLFDDDDIK
jgi:hypothetical protein